MGRFVGIKNNKIVVISDKSFTNKDYLIIPVPKDLESISSESLILNYKIENNKIILKKSNKLASELKVALVANYGSQCGIGTYSKFLFDELTPSLGDYKIFSEEGSEPSDKVIPCWKRGESLTKLINEIKKYNPDILLLQHEFGLFPNARYWLSMMNQLSDYRIIVTMHSIFRHLDKSIVEACIPEIIVHLQDAKSVLIDKGISSKIHVIPHGCFPCVDKTKLWNFYKSNHTLIQFGFLFRYKSYETTIRAVSLLKNKYPDIFLTGLCSESPHAKVEHEIYYNELMELVNSLSLQENVALIRGFQTEKVLNSYLRMNKAAVFPYVGSKEHECFGSSGAAPYTMTKGIPVISSNIHHFKNLPTIKAESPEEIAEKLDQLFTNEKMGLEQIEIQNSYLLENSWTKIAQKYISVFENR
jgi:glycosyltransferase involved in cell wall biosynthesis